MAVAVSWAPRMENVIWGYAIALLPMIPGLFLTVGIVRVSRKLDEMENRILLEAVAFSFIFTLIMLLSFALSVSLTRLFLALTGYPQLGGGELHISHVLWGGLFLFIGALLPLLVANRWVYRITAILAGIGIGLFIDEVGKFVTASYDYFYAPAAPIIYAFFLICVLIYVRISQPRPRHPRSELYATLELLEEVLDHDLDAKEQHEIKNRLAYVIEQAGKPDLTRLAQDLYDYFDTNELVLTPSHPGWLQRITARLREVEAKHLDRFRLKNLLVWGLLLLGIGSIVIPIFSTIFFFLNYRSGQVTEVLWYVFFQLVLFGAGIYLVVGALRIRKGAELQGLRSSYITLVIYLTIINLFLFYYYQFAIILAAIFQFILLLGVMHYQRSYVNQEEGDLP